MASEVDSEVDSDLDSDIEALVKDLKESSGGEIFEQVHAIDPTICPPCVNIICAFSDQENIKPFRTSQKPSESGLWHHRRVKGLLECSSTCPMCALLCHLARIYKSKYSSEFERILEPETPSEDELVKALVKLVDRDEELFVDSLVGNERSLWRRSRYFVIQESFHLCYQANTERDDTTAEWIVAYRFKHFDADGPIAIQKLNRRQALLNNWAWELQTPKQVSSTASSALLPDTDLSLAAKTLYNALLIIQDLPYNWYCLKEITGHGGYPVELQLENNTKRYGGARVYTHSGLCSLPSRYLSSTDTIIEDALSRKHLGRPIQINPNSPDTFKLLKYWVDTCARTHCDCNSLAGVSGLDPILPSRVIDIGKLVESVPKLLVGKPKRGKWVALSHRWGQDDFLTLVTSNVEEMERGIILSRLPATFRDAIVITRLLGLQYLWIDSLCIIQDSVNDWLNESADMPNIYRNAYVTVAAAATDKSTGGIFVDRIWTANSKPCQLPIPLAQSKASDSDMSFGTLHFDVPFDLNPSNEEINHLRTRAWCFQESQLSHRLLTFDRQQLSYTCVREGLLESRALPGSLAREGRNTFLSQFQQPLVPGDSARLRQLIIIWYNLLSDYTRRELTSSNDKLVAISGVANVIGTCIHDEYYAGLWRKDMPGALLWSPYDEELLPSPHEASLPSCYRAPSWSWASIDGSISFFLCRERQPRPPIATIIELSTTLVGPDTYGQVKEGFLRIRAPLKHAFRDEVTKGWPKQPRLRWDVSDEQDITHGVFDTAWPELGTQLWCLQITAFYGLILAKKRGDNDKYSRIGIFHLRTTATRNPEWFTGDDIVTITIV